MRKLLSILALLAVAGCKKTPGDPGPTGANTFSCQIDGRDIVNMASIAVVDAQSGGKGM